MEAPVVHLSINELEFKKRETQVGISRLKNLWEQGHSWGVESYI